MNMDIRNRLGQVVLWALVATTLLITPFFSSDPTNLPRFFLAITHGFIGFFMLLGLKSQLLVKKYRKVEMVTAGFIAWAFVATFVSGINLIEGFFGVSGRQTGFLTYFAYAVLMLCAVFASHEVLQKKIIRALILVGLITGLYGVVQAIGGDPVDWQNPYSPVIGLFGNPNFQASFMGMVGTAASALSLEKSLKLKIRVGFLVVVLLALFNINKTNSQQGYLVFLVGATVVGYLYVRENSRIRRLSWAYASVAIVGFLAISMDILQKAPWTSFLYKESVTFRGDFWRAGWKMTTEHPFFGVGLDGYRDHYRASRDLVTVLRPGSDVMTDSAHNIFIDISSGGGFPLLFLYLYAIGLTAWSAIKIIRRSEKLSSSFIAIVGTWVAYLSQSLISIGSIGLSLWGWVLMGLIIGYEINSRERSERKSATSAYPNLAVAAGLVIGLIVGLPPVVADATFRSNVKSGDVIKIEASVRQWPQSVTRLTYVAQLLREGNLPARSIVIAREAVVFNPMNYEAWRELYLQPNATQSERENALLTMRKLDPLNPNLK
jgi:O-antigen ligase